MLAWCLEEEARVTSHILIRTVSDDFVLTFRLELRFHIRRVQLTTETCRAANLTTLHFLKLYIYLTAYESRRREWPRAALRCAWRQVNVF
jgi:hypothetical protein